MNTELDISKTVKKSNVLNELRNANASLVEYRLFCVYLAHLPMNSENNVVTFSLADYARIVKLDRARYIDLKTQAENIVGVTATLPNEDGGFSVYPLFSEFKLFKDKEIERWMVSLECNSKIAPMIREQKNRFLRYKLYNTIYLKSYNQQRIYELLKQYEKIGYRDISLVDLREFLSIAENEYPVWGVFSRDVLKVAQKALKENTDIYFEYEPFKKGRKVAGVRFNIYKNNSFIDQLQLHDFLSDEAITEDFEGENEGELVIRAAENDSSIFVDDIDENQHSLFDIPKYEYSNAYVYSLAEACDFEFNQTEMELLMSEINKKPFHSDIFTEQEALAREKYDFIQKAYRTLNYQATKIDIDNRVTYLQGIIRNMDIE